MHDLWPSFPTVPLKAPVTILKEQASFLGQKTQNLVEAEVRPFAPELMQNQPHTSLFVYDFNIVAPALGHYRYHLLQIRHDVGLYPVEIHLDPDILNEIAPRRTFEEHIEAHSEGEFLEALTNIFGTKKTRQVITGLLAQVSPLPPPEEIPF